MGRISQRKLNDALEERIYEIFWEHLAGLPTASLIKEFLESLLSKTEQVMLSKRLAIAILISRGHTYEHIDNTLKVSKSTIATVHRELLVGAPGYERAIKESNSRKQKEKLWDSLEELFLSLSMPARVGSARHALKSAIGKDLWKRKYVRENI